MFFGDAEPGQLNAITHKIIESCRRRGIDPHAYLSDVLTLITESTNWNVADLIPQKWAKNKIPLKKGGVGAVIVVAFTYDIYTTLLKNNGVLGAYPPTKNSEAQKSSGNEMLPELLLKGVY